MALRASLRRPPSSGDGAGEVAAPVDPGEAKRWPTLLPFLTETAWDDGEARETATIFLFCETGRYKACLRDRDAGHTAFVSGDTLLGVLDALEKGLVRDSLDWRPDREKKPAKRS